MCGTRSIFWSDLLRRETLNRSADSVEILGPSCVPLTLYVRRRGWMTFTPRPCTPTVQAEVASGYSL